LRYQLTAIVVGILTLLALAAAATVIWINVGADDDDRLQLAAEGEFGAFEAALQARIEALRTQATALLQEQDVVNYAVRGGNTPDLLNNGRISRGGADYLLVSGPGRRLVLQTGLTDAIVNPLENSAPEAIYLLDGAVDGGIFDFADGPVLAAGASTGPGTERAAIALGIRLDAEALAGMVGSPGRRLTLTWASTQDAPDGVQVLAGTAPGRVSLVGPVELAHAQRSLVVAIDAPASILPASAGAGLTRWLGILIALGAAGVVGFGILVRTMASSVGDVRTGLLAAAETDGNPAVLESLSGADEVGLAAAQAAVTLHRLRERTVAAIDEARVATARQLLGEHVIRSMHEGVLVERADTTCIVCNPAASRLLDIQAAAVLGARGTLSDVLGDALYARLIERARNPEAAQRLDVVSIAGRDLAFDAYEVPEYRSEGHSLLIIVRDVSAVLEVEQLKRDIVSVVSHELRTPLTVVALSMGMLQEPGADQAQLLAAAERNVQRMRELVDDMLDLARLESGEADPQFESHPPVLLVQDVVEFLRPQAREKDVIVRDAVDGEIPDTIQVDRKQIQRAVTNLLSNAIKFSPAGADVWVVLRDGGTHLFIDIVDSGPGVPLEEQERIFTRFYRATNTREKIAGTGLGLSIVRQIVELHGGTCQILPTEHGSYFRIALPLAPRSA
jgi:signal transduction histidine kinase